LYAHDFSEFHEIELGADGRFGYKHLPLYWREPNRRPLLVKVDGKLAGAIDLFGHGTDSHPRSAVIRATFYWDRATTPARLIVMADRQSRPKSYSQA
jgi:predicted acetyltransferase